MFLRDRCPSCRGKYIAKLAPGSSTYQCQSCATTLTMTRASGILTSIGAVIGILWVARLYPYVLGETLARNQIVLIVILTFGLICSLLGIITPKFRVKSR